MAKQLLYDNLKVTKKIWKIIGVLVLILLLILICSTIGLWLYFSYDYLPSLIELQSNVDIIMEFDFIIVGAGTAGSVMAHDLSTYSNHSVLLIESGGIFSALSIIPLASTFMQTTHEDWSFKTTPQKFSSIGLTNRQQMIPRGKGLGGSSQINYMLHFNGIEQDFKNWAQLGATEWNYNNMKYWLHRHQTEDAGGACKDPVKFSSLILDEISENHCEPHQYNSTKLPNLKIKQAPASDPLAKALMEASSIFESQNKPVGYRLAEFTIKNGVRWNAYHEYLRPANHRNLNLKVLKTTRVHKIMFDDAKHATHVLVSPDRDTGTLSKIRARKEIILSAGAIQSPQILKLSGIGPTKELLDHKIPVVHDSSKVGTNLFDHMSLPLFVSIQISASVTKPKILSFKAVYQYLVHGTGVLSTSAVVGLGTAQNDTFGTILFGMGTADENALREIANYRQETFRAIFPLYNNASQEGVIFLSSCHQPKSRGTIRLQSEKVSMHPEIDTNYLADDYDIECMRRAIRFAVETVKTKPFVDIGAQIHWPKFKECAKLGPFAGDFRTNRPSDEYLECFIRVGAITTYHPGGTCAIGDAADSVLDNDLRVRGVTGLRVVDASIFPAPVSGTPNSVIIAVTERAAHLVLQQQSLH